MSESLFFNKIAVLKPAALLKKRIWYKYFPVDFAKFLRTPFSQNTSRQVSASNNNINLLQNHLLPYATIIGTLQNTLNMNYRQITKIFAC